MQKTNDGKKYCPKCKIEKLVSDFNKDKSKSDGLMCLCKKCKRQYRLSDFYRMRERELERTRGYKERRKKYTSSPRGKHYESKKDHSNKINNGVSRTDLTYEQWEFILKCQDYRCAVCQREFSQELKSSRDCVLPLSKGGSLTFGNTQALCRSCNAKKGVRVYMGLLNAWRKSL
jgi:5-methylcytosine-specific restriction endonuclease McrA